MKTDQISGLQEPSRPGVVVKPLFADERAEVRIEEWEAGAEVMIDAPSGAELLVLSGSFTSEAEDFRT